MDKSLYLCSTKSSENSTRTTDIMNRIISFLHSFGIVGIVIWHAQAISGSRFLMDWLYTFVLPVMFFASGYLFNEKDFWKKKSRRILLPYLAFSTLVFFPKVLLSQFALRPVELSWHSYFHQLVIDPTENVMITLWFLPALFIIMLLFRLLRIAFHKMKLERYRWILLAALYVCCGAYYGITIEHDLFYSRIALFLPVFILGHEMKTRNRCTAPFKHDYGLAAVGLAVTLMVAFVDNNHSWPYLFFMPIGTAMVIAFASIYERRGWKFMDHLHGSHMTIYLLHWFVQTVTIAVFRRLCGEEAPLSMVLLFQAIAIIGGIYLPWVCYKKTSLPRKEGMNK